MQCVVTGKFWFNDCPVNLVPECLKVMDGGQLRALEEARKKQVEHFAFKLPVGKVYDW